MWQIGWVCFLFLGLISSLARYRQKPIETLEENKPSLFAASRARLGLAASIVRRANPEGRLHRQTLAFWSLAPPNVSRTRTIISRNQEPGEWLPMASAVRRLI
jgi:hypothetical protein